MSKTFTFDSIDFGNGMTGKNVTMKVARPPLCFYMSMRREGRNNCLTYEYFTVSSPHTPTYDFNSRPSPVKIHRNAFASLRYMVKRRRELEKRGWEMKYDGVSWTLEFRPSNCPTFHEALELSKGPLADWFNDDRSFEMLMKILGVKS